MVKSESELKKKTKLQLMQWLTKNGQRLPANERLKPYYLQQAIKTFRASQEIAKPQSQRKKKYGKSVVSTTRTKKKGSNANNSLTPKSRSKNAPLVRTQRRHSSITSPSPSLNRSKKRSIKIARKTPTKQSPVLARSIKRKRERVRRATADPANLAKELEQSMKQDSENSENSGDCYNAQQLKQPEKMTIHKLQEWLDENHIDFVTNQRKAVYVNLVKKHTNSKKRNLSPNHKKRTSPHFKKPKANESSIAAAAAPLPANILQSPLTPQDDEKHTRSRVQKQNKGKNNLLLTPVLNKTDLKIDTPSKLAMRDEIRCLLQLSDDEGPSYPVSQSTDDRITPGGNDGITPGGPNEYDADALENVLKDLRRENKPKKANKERVKVYDPDAKQEIKESKSFLSSIMAKFSPHKATSSKSIKNQINDVLNTNKQKRKVSYIAKRTVPSPASPQAFVEDMNNGNFSSNNNAPLSPLNDYQERFEVNRYQDDEPMSPAMNRSANNNNAVRKSKRLAENKEKKQSPIKKVIKSYSDKKKIYSAAVDADADKKKIYSADAKRAYVQNRKQAEAPLVPYSLPKQNANPAKDETKPSHNEAPIKKQRCRTVIKILFLAAFGAVIGCLFAVFDGVSVTNDLWQNLNEFLTDFYGETQILFCDSGKKSIGSGANVHCVDCPLNALVCMNGRAQCRTNYILQDSKCVLNGVVVKYAYELNKQIAQILSERKGSYECGEIHAIDDGYTMKEDELMSMCEIFDASKKHEAFEYFVQKILPESIVIDVNNKGEYFSYKMIKSPICQIKEWAKFNKLGLGATFAICCVVVALWRSFRNTEWEKKEVENLMTRIYNILEEFDRFNKQSHVPIDVIKQRILTQNTLKLWKKVDLLIQKDANISKSIRMIDGLQKRCLALSSVANSAPTFPAYSKRSMW